MLFFVWLGVYGKTKSLWIWDAPLIATNLCIKYLSDITLLLTEISTQFKNHVSFVPLQQGRTLKRAELFRMCF